MRALTALEKVASEAARKRVNKVFGAKRTEIGVQLRKLPITAERRRKELWAQCESVRDIKGLPVKLRVNDVEIVVNYELYRRMMRTLKGRRWCAFITVTPITGARALIIDHKDWHSSSNGTITFNELPQYQRDLLSDLPIIESTE
ncbi:hypothetical protein [Paenibacillus paeoniae]|uniref:Uncharacterized protein n=1 Tax=Paenibacillus paeoniae TaxID=2292705 RepID=A0A371P089_9BACL|nr:hypothetical protein [Paenibacillus paeoniae]REK69325.1 hypothetical protein DX130_24500 [Paenibacillus paeoniae]